MKTILVRRAALTIVVVGVAAIGTISAQGRSSAGQSRAPMRFAALDVNRDGVITRREWNGSDRAFEVHDWNQDGILSGEEVRQGATRRTPDDQPTESTDRYYDDWTIRGFVALDRNRDNRVSREEWQSDVETFRRADANRDGVLTRPEFLGEDTPEPPRDSVTIASSTATGLAIVSTVWTRTTTAASRARNGPARPNGSRCSTPTAMRS